MKDKILLETIQILRFFDKLQEKRKNALYAAAKNGYVHLFGSIIGGEVRPYSSQVFKNSKIAC